MQRAKVRAIARATGIGWSLYENGDLQFEEDEKLDKKGKKPDVKSIATTAPQPVVIPDASNPPGVQTVLLSAEAEEAAQPVTQETGASRILAMIGQAEPAKVETAFAFMNKQLAKLSPDVLFAPDMTLEQAEIILSRVKNPAVVENSLRAQLGLTNA
jgi:hypothetical protein